MVHFTLQAERKKQGNNRENSEKTAIANDLRDDLFFDTVSRQSSLLKFVPKRPLY